VADVVSDSIRKLIQRYILSVEQLDILLVLKRSPDKFLSAQDVFNTIQSSVASVTERLQKLQSDGFLDKDGNEPPRYRYNPKTQELASAVAELQNVYKESPVKVIEAIYSGANQQARDFAESFRFRK